ncbi:hypothetical protein VF21_07319 [Pseudogymnoascus sp. 05NY08]|nr:hypothetical protein VF21_07319 [Pseudogymnoascus sp. 05NY08]
MSDLPEVYQPLPQSSPHAGHTGPYYGGPRPESEGLQVNSAYVENYNKAPYSDNPALGPQGAYQQQQPYQQQPYQQGQQQGQYINPPLGHQTQYAEDQPGGLIQPAPYATTPQIDEKGRKKRICGLSVVVFWCLVVAALLIVVGAVVGGVVGSQKAKDSHGAGPAAGGDTSGTSSGVTTTPTATTTEPTSTGTTTTASATATARFDEGTFYRLSNQFLKAAYSLDIEKDNGTLSRKLNMSLTADSDGQYWQIKKVPNTDERYWFACLYLGKDIRLFLDPLDRINPLMATADDTATGSSGIDTHGLFMDLKDDTGTEWSIAEARKITTADGFL